MGGCHPRGRELFLSARQIFVRKPLIKTNTTKTSRVWRGRGGGGRKSPRKNKWQAGTGMKESNVTDGYGEVLEICHRLGAHKRDRKRVRRKETREGNLILIKSNRWKWSAENKRSETDRKQIVKYVGRLLPCFDLSEEKHFVCFLLFLFHSRFHHFIQDTAGPLLIQFVIGFCSFFAMLFAFYVSFYFCCNNWTSVSSDGQMECVLSCVFLLFSPIFSVSILASKEIRFG